MTEAIEPTFFESSAEFRRSLEANHAAVDARRNIVHSGRTKKKGR